MLKLQKASICKLFGYFAIDLFCSLKSNILQRAQTVFVLLLVFANKCAMLFT
jgi:hypothetical protein